MKNTFLLRLRKHFPLLEQRQNYKSAGLDTCASELVEASPWISVGIDSTAKHRAQSYSDACCG